MPLESRPDWLELRRSLDRLPAPRWLVFGENSRLSPRILLIWTLRLDWLLMLIVVLGMDCLLRKISCFLAADRFLPCLDLEDFCSPWKDSLPLSLEPVPDFPDFLRMYYREVIGESHVAGVVTLSLLAWSRVCPVTEVERLDLGWWLWWEGLEV